MPPDTALPPLNGGTRPPGPGHMLVCLAQAGSAWEHQPTWGQQAQEQSKVLGQVCVGRVGGAIRLQAGACLLASAASATTGKGAWNPRAFSHSCRHRSVQMKRPGSWLILTAHVCGPVCLPRHRFVGLACPALLSETLRSLGRTRNNHTGGNSTRLCACALSDSPGKLGRSPHGGTANRPSGSK